MKYYITDVFSVGKYSGNQLATFILDQEIESETMQKIAQEVNYSETTFLNPEKQKYGRYEVRIFTPKAEVDFAGHPTLGTAYILKEFIEAKSKRVIKLNLKVGEIDVELKNHMYWMKQVQPEFGDAVDPKLVAEMLNLELKDIDQDFSVQGVTTGLPFTIVPLINKVALLKSRLNMDVYNEYIKATWAKGIMVFCRGGYTALQDLSTRVFVPWLGITEDPATGSSTGCLAAWLLKNNFYGTSFINIACGQGYEINRPSELHIEAALEKGNYDINVGGDVEFIAQGEWGV